MCAGFKNWFITAFSITVVWLTMNDYAQKQLNLSKIACLFFFQKLNFKLKIHSTQSGGCNSTLTHRWVVPTAQSAINYPT